MDLEDIHHFNIYRLANAQDKTIDINSTKTHGVHKGARYIMHLYSIKLPPTIIDYSQTKKVLISDSKTHKQIELTVCTEVNMPKLKAYLKLIGHKFVENYFNHHLMIAYPPPSEFKLIKVD